MIPGALSQRTFEEEVLPGLLPCADRAREGNHGTDCAQDAATMVVPYCTVGYRSGLYCRELTGAHKLTNVRNAEGIIMWTFDGGSLVRPVLGPDAKPRHAPQLEKRASAACHWTKADGGTEEAEVVWKLHVYGRPWDFAAEGYSTVYFSRAAGLWHFACTKCAGGANASVALWLWTLAIFYLLFTPACGVMFKCACQMAVTKFGQVSTCLMYNDPTAHKCPWCSCTGFACLLVSSDRRALRDVPLLDMLPDGSFLTVFTVIVMLFAWSRIDKSFNARREAAARHLKARGESPCSLHFAMKALVPVVWFLVYTVSMGALFFAFSPDYPYFFSIVRDEKV